LTVIEEAPAVDLSFRGRVKDLIVDPRVAAQAIARDVAADRCIRVFFTPRSGSSWLTKIVSATARLGRLEEFINPDFIRDVAKSMHATDQATLLAMLQRWTKTGNGVFSMEVRAVDIQLFGEPEYFASFSPGAVNFFLWRDNIVAQGVSLYRAVTTKRYHSTDAPGAPPNYNVEEIARWMRHIVGVENENLKLLKRRGLSARFLRYEDIVRDRVTTLMIIADSVRVDLTAEQLEASREQALDKIGDEWNLSAERRFRQERRDFIWELEEQRLIRDSHM
jgi:LPS sulfotransferase NodH